MVIKLNPRKLVMTLIGVMGILIIANLIGLIPLYNGTRAVPPLLTNFDREPNLPSLFSTMLLAICGLLVLAIALANRDEKGAYLQWLGMAGIFFFLSIDETVLIHERATHAVRHLVEVNRMGLSHAAWTIPYMALTLLVVSVYWRFVFKLPRETKWTFVTGVALYLMGAVVMEFVSCIWLDSTSRNVGFYLLATVEETLEMTGAIVIIHAFAGFLNNYHPDLCVTVSSEQ